MARSKRSPVPDDPKQSTLRFTANGGLAIRTDRVLGNTSQVRLPGFFRRGREVAPATSPGAAVASDAVLGIGNLDVGAIAAPGDALFDTEHRGAAGDAFSIDAEDVAPPSPDADLDMDRRCVICMSAGREHALLPCLHRCCCPRCAATLCGRPFPKCPMCRVRVRGHGKVYD